jgi:hypothetical protein
MITNLYPKKIEASDDLIVSHNYENYTLIVNPAFTFYGEVIFTPDGKLSDYGSLPSMRPLIYDNEITQHIKFEPVVNKSIISSNILNFDEKQILSESDLSNFVQLVHEIKGLGMIKILPFSYSEYKDLSANTIKVVKLPIKDIGYEELPLTIKIRQELRHVRREKLLSIVKDDDIKIRLDSILDNPSFNECLDSREFLKIDSYDFPHLVQAYTVNSFNLSNVQANIANMLRLLNINNMSECGLVILLTAEYLFMAPLTKSYIVNKDIPIFVDAHFYAGVFTLPLIEAEWPDTLNGDHIRYELLNILKTSSS